MKKLHLVIVGFGLIGLVSGCASSKGDLQEIAYEGTSSDTPIVPKETDTISEGEVTAGDEVITPTGPVAGADEYVAEPEIPSIPSEPAAPIDGIADGGEEPTPDDIGTPPLPPAVSCDEPAFAFVSKRTGVSNVFVRKSSDVHALTDLRGVALSDLTVRPRTRSLTFTETALFFQITASLDLDGPVATPSLMFDEDGTGGADRITRSAVWSPDGSNMAYVHLHHVGGRLVPEIFLKNEDRAIVTNAGGRNEFYGIAWAGAQIIASVDTKDDDADAQLAVYDTVRGNFYGLVDMTTITPTVGTSPAASPDGKSIAFVKKDSFGTEQIYRCNLDRERFGMGTLGSGGEITVCRVVAPLTSGSVNTQPAWSRDGRWIYFVSERDGNKEIYRMKTDGTGATNLTNNPAADTSPAPFAPYASCE